jgi:hypothetical protein
VLLKLPQLDVTRLAADYSAAVRAQLSASQLATIAARNAAEHDAGVDHIHDFVDANEILAGAVMLQMPQVDDWQHIADDMNIAQARAKGAGYQLSRILVACEFSGTVRDAFAARGHSVISCDILPTESPGNHYQGDVRDIMDDGYHLMIAHPPCTYLANSGVKHLRRAGQDINPERWQDMRDGAEFFNDLGAADVPRICRENPIMHKYAFDIIGRRAEQYIQPYQFGHDHSKKTGLHLDNLPALPIPDRAQWIAPRVIEYRGRMVNRWANQSPCGADKTSPSADRGHKRSGFFSGIAESMADTWGNIAATTPRAPRATIAQMELFA